MAALMKYPSTKAQPDFQKKPSAVRAPAARGLRIYITSMVPGVGMKCR